MSNGEFVGNLSDMVGKFESSQQITWPFAHLKRAGAEEIAALPGISVKAAAAILEWLGSR